MTGWTPAKEQVIRHMWEVLGHSASQIAAVVGLTKNQVLGRIHRENWKQLPKPEKPGYQNGLPQVEQRRKIASSPRSAFSRQWSQPDTETPEFVDLSPLRRPAREPLRIGPVRECVYPSGAALPYTFCGEATLPGSSYCETHHKVCYRSASTPVDAEAA